VAIADVAHFVPRGGAIDAEARRRGNSFYFPDRAIPMLPERLSSEMCSLRPDVDRLAMVVELRIVADGQVADAIFHEAVIRSHARLSYGEAAAWLENPELDSTRWGESLRCLDKISDQLLSVRRARGAISLELPEIKIVLDENGRPVDAVVRERNRAHVLIEEAMLAANRAVAAGLDRAGRTTLHRVHPPPSPQKLAALAILLDRLALQHDGALEEPGVIAAILEAVRGTPSEEQVHMATLRSMSQARYEAEPGGHYALRFEHYLHFTSPIRRYADLDVHRALKALLRGASEQDPRRSEDCARLGIWLSGRERVAVEVERDAESLACCAILKGREGERFTAKVSAASEFGLFIRLDSPAASGLVPIRTLEGEWDFDPDEEILIGPRGRARMGRGDSLDVRLLEVDADRGRLAFRLNGSESATGRRLKGRKRR
jgi:ribonuclease R